MRISGPALALRNTKCNEEKIPGGLEVKGYIDG